MKKALLITSILAGSISTSHAVSLLSETFTYADGALVGQGGWTQIQTTSTNPVPVAGGAVSLTTSGQDVGVAFTPAASSGSLYAAFDLTLSAAQSAGDYFFAFNTAAGATNYNSRFFAKSSGTGFVLGLQEGITGATPTYMTGDLVFGTKYRIVLRYDFVTGTLNNTGTFYVNPLSNTEGDNTSAVGTVAWAGTSAEDASEAAVALRQGTAASAPTISSFDNLNVATTFAEAAQVVPEPTTTLALIGGLGVLGLTMRRRSS